jgi:hypothetical protein
MNRDARRKTMDRFVDADGVPTSKLALAQDHWLRLSQHQRLTLMQQVAVVGSLEKGHRALMEHIAENALDFHVSDGGVLSASVRVASVDPGMRKVFLGMWSETVFHNDGTRVIDEDFFTESNGYNDEDRRGVAELEVGETWKSEPYGESHTVTRLLDTKPTQEATEREVAPSGRQGMRP